MKITIDDEKLQKLHWTHLKKLVEANGAHYDGFGSKDEAELYVIEQTEFTKAAIELIRKYDLADMSAPSDSADESVTEPEATSEAEPETGANDADAAATETDTTKADDNADAPEDEDKAEAEPETKDEPEAEADSDIPVFDHNRPHGKISGLCAARFYQDGHHFGGDYRFIPASEVE